MSPPATSLRTERGLPVVAPVIESSTLDPVRRPARVRCYTRDPMTLFGKTTTTGPLAEDDGAETTSRSDSLAAGPTLRCREVQLLVEEA